MFFSEEYLFGSEKKGWFIKFVYSEKEARGTSLLAL